MVDVSRGHLAASIPQQVVGFGFPLYVVSFRGLPHLAEFATHHHVSTANTVSFRVGTIRCEFRVDPEAGTSRSLTSDLIVLIRSHLTKETITTRLSIRVAIIGRDTMQRRRNKHAVGHPNLHSDSLVVFLKATSRCVSTEGFSMRQKSQIGDKEGGPKAVRIIIPYL